MESSLLDGDMSLVFGERNRGLWADFFVLYSCLVPVSAKTEEAPDLGEGCWGQRGYRGEGSASPLESKGVAL